MEPKCIILTKRGLGLALKFKDMLLLKLAGGPMISSKRLKTLLSITVGFFVLLSYQNCGVGYTTDAQDFFSKKLGRLSFSYEASADQVAYMSCSEQDGVAYPYGVMFSFRVGAYRAGSGLRLSDDFYEFSEKFDKFEKADLLGLSPTHSGAKLSFSFRQQGNFQSMFLNGSSGTDGVPEVDYGSVFGSLGTDDMTASLLGLEQGKWMRHWAAAGINDDAKMEGDMTFFSSEALAQDLRNFLSQSGRLVLGYQNVGSLSLKSPGGSGSIYGMKLSLKFRQPLPSIYQFGGGAHIKVPQRVLASVVETGDDSGPGKVGGNWQCPTNMAFMIVNPDDAGALGCSAGVPDPSTDSRVSIVRKSLKVGDWWVDWNKNCIVPKRYAEGMCYGIHSGTGDAKLVNYDFNKECDPAVQKPGINVCPHFASICFRTP